MFKIVNRSLRFCKVLRLQQETNRFLSISSIQLQQQAAPKYDFDQALSKAGELVRYRLDDIATMGLIYGNRTLNFENHLKKLIETNHPILETIK